MIKMAPCEGLVPEANAEEKSQTHNGLITNVSSGKFKDRPACFDVGITTVGWLKGKRIDDDIGPYWRVHNKLYDLTDFAKIHPGGKEWITMTKGTDITEAFESSHISLTAEKILSKYFVKDIDTPRNSPYTFHEDGFFRTLKRKVRPVLEKIGQGPSRQMLLMQDMLFIGFIGLTICASVIDSKLLVIFAGIVLAMNIMCAHNFFHQRDSFRMYYWDFSLLTSYDWRISHGLSHHLFTNTRYDLEIVALEPVYVFLPKPGKNFLQRYLAQVYQVVIAPTAFYIELIKRIYIVVTGQTPLRPENLLPLLELVVMCGLSSSVATGIRLWLILHAACSSWFSTIGVLVAHHHPQIYHEGDKFRENPDWGLCQLDAVRDRIEVKGNLFLVATTFGDHSLHHLLPTVDHSKLDALYPAFFETCHEFNIPFEFLSQWELARGTYQQLARNKPNPNPPGYKDKHD
ncbi:cytochrome b5-related protein-like isoform X2 [Palaemon carinicauda]|uniref:cytochrome b5-related protein-like isoform X2 n=1 Tax=Palaemon carinicauda TaxID=392227 RepID=UPI0035B654F0